jgi:hypothetical protein
MANYRKGVLRNLGCYPLRKCDTGEILVSSFDTTINKFEANLLTTELVYTVLSQQCQDIDHKKQDVNSNDYISKVLKNHHLQISINA